MAALAGALILLSPVFRGFAFYTGHSRGIDWYTWFVLDGLAAGSLLAILLRTRITRKQAIRLCAVMLAAALIAAVIGAPFGMLTRERLLGAALQFSVVHLLSTGVVLMVLIVGSGGHRRLVNNRLLQFFGYISYGLYLVHMLVFRFWDGVYKRFFPFFVPQDGRFDLVVLRFVLVLGAATAVAYLSRRY